MIKPLREITLAELAGQLGGQLEGDGTKIVRGANRIQDARPDEIAFLANPRYRHFMAATQAAAVIVAHDYQGPGQSLIRCQDPYFAYRQTMVLLYGFRSHPFSGIDPSARLDPSARIADGASVAGGVTICAGAEIGPRSVLYPGVFVGPDCRIGRDCIIYPNVVIYADTVIGDRVILHGCCVIGQDGFGYSTHAGKHEKIPPVGRVEIGDDVEMGAGCCVDRATMGATVIGPGTKFSNGVVIGHGSAVGKGCLFSAQAGIAGSVSVGDYAAFGAQSGVSNHISLGKLAKVAAKSGVMTDVPASQEVGGTPAIPLVQAMRALSLLPQLPEMRRQLKKLQDQLAALQDKLEGK